MLAPARCFVFAMLLATVLSSANASAEGVRQRVEVDRFSGPGGELLRRRVIRSLEKDPELEVTRRSDGEEARVHGSVERRGRRYWLRVRVVVVRDGTTALEIELSGPNVWQLDAAARRALIDFASDVRSAVSEPIELEEELEAEPEPDPEPPPRKAAPPPRARARWFEARAAVGMVARRLRFAPDVAETEPQYTLSDAPAASVDLHVRPLHDAGDWRADLGLVGALSAARAITEGEAGRRLETRSWQWDLGVALRVLREPELGLDLRYGGQSFQVQADPELGKWIADVDYRYVRLGLQLRADMGRAFARAGVGYRVVGSVGELGDDAHLAGLRAHGYDAELALGVAVSPQLALFVAGRYARYELARGAENVGFDEYPSLWIGVAR